MMASLTPSPQMVALVQASTTLPIMLLSIWAGAVADNLDRRKVMLCAQGFMFLASAALALFSWWGLLTPWLLLMFTFLIGCGVALNSPAWQASVGDMVPRSALPSAIALNSMGFNIARSVGPAIGGVIVAAGGAAAAFLVNTLSYFGLIAALARWQPEKAPSKLPRERLGTAMRAGLRYVAMSPNLLVVLMRACVFGLSASALQALMPLVARDLMRGGALVYGLLLGAFGIGAVIGALASGRLRRTLSAEQIVRGATMLLAAGTLTAAVSRMLPLTLLGLVLAGAGWVLALSTFNVTVQLASPRWVVARALALYQMAAFGGMAAGSWLFGSLADAQGVDVALIAAAAAQIAGLLLAFRYALPQIEGLDLTPFTGWTRPESALPLEARSGPIVITTEYRIAEENYLDFIRLMNERRRIRRRDGARNWTLLRDLADPQLWVERYHVPTWVEYARHHERRTKQDLQVFEQIRALHIGAPPRVQRFIERQTGSLPLSRDSGPRELADPLTDPSRST
jgi:MFS family permease